MVDSYVLLTVATNDATNDAQRHYCVKENITNKRL